MTRLYITLFIVLSTLVTKAASNHEIKIPDNYKNLKTFSGKHLDSSSFHLIFSKNKKNDSFEMFFYFFKDEEIIKFPSLISASSYSVVANHSTDNEIILFLSYTFNDEPFIKKITYNLNTEKVSETKPISHKNFYLAVPDKGRTILVYKSKSSFRIDDYVNNNLAIKKSANIVRRGLLHQFLKNESISYVRTDEFVKNGATNTIKCYLDNNVLYLTRDSQKKVLKKGDKFGFTYSELNLTQLLKIDLNLKNISFDLSTFENKENLFDTTSYYHSGKLYQYSLSSSKGIISIYDTETKELLSDFLINDSLTNIITSDNFIGISKYISKASRSKYVPTITVNSTKTNFVRVLLDYVDVTYYYNPMLMHNMWMQQQMFHQQSVQRAFGPAIYDEIIVENYLKEEKDHFFELVFDNSGNFIKDNIPELYYKEINKKKYTDIINRDKKTKFLSTCFLENSCRYIFYDVEKKVLVINSVPLD